MRDRPCAMAHVALTVPDIDAAIAWYGEVFGLSCIAGPYELVPLGQPPDEGLVDALGPAFASARIAHLTCANGVGIELFQFRDPTTVTPDDNYRYWEVGYFHICMVDPGVDDLVKRIVQAGGRARTQKARPVFEGGPYLWAFCEDPFGNVIEIYSHTYAEIYSNKTIRGHHDATASSH